MAPVKKVTKTYRKEHQISCLSRTLSKNSPMKTRQARKIKRAIKIKELPKSSPILNNLTSDSINVSLYNTFDKLLLGKSFNNVKKTNDYMQYKSSEDSNANCSENSENIPVNTRSFCKKYKLSPMKGLVTPKRNRKNSRKRVKNKPKIIITNDSCSTKSPVNERLQKTLERPVDESLWIEKVRQGPSFSSLSYIKLSDNVNTSSSKLGSSSATYEAFKARHTISSSTPLVGFPFKTTPQPMQFSIKHDSANNEKYTPLAGRPKSSVTTNSMRKLLAKKSLKNIIISTNQECKDLFESGNKSLIDKPLMPLSNFGDLSIRNQPKNSFKQIINEESIDLFESVNKSLTDTSLMNSDIPLINFVNTIPAKNVHIIIPDQNQLKNSLTQTVNDESKNLFDSVNKSNEIHSQDNCKYDEANSTNRSELGNNLSDNDTAADPVKEAVDFTAESTENQSYFNDNEDVGGSNLFLSNSAIEKERLLIKEEILSDINDNGTISDSSDLSSLSNDKYLQDDHSTVPDYKENETNFSNVPQLKSTNLIDSETTDNRLQDSDVKEVVDFVDLTDESTKNKFDLSYNEDIVELSSYISNSATVEPVKKEQLSVKRRKLSDIFEFDKDNETNLSDISKFNLDNSLQDNETANITDNETKLSVRVDYKSQLNNKSDYGTGLSDSPDLIHVSYANDLSANISMQSDITDDKSNISDSSELSMIRIRKRSCKRLSDSSSLRFSFNKSDNEDNSVTSISIRVDYQLSSEKVVENPTKLSGNISDVIRDLPNNINNITQPSDMSDISIDEKDNNEIDRKENGKKVSDNLANLRKDLSDIVESSDIVEPSMVVEKKNGNEQRERKPLKSPPKPGKLYRRSLAVSRKTTIVHKNEDILLDQNSGYVLSENQENISPNLEASFRNLSLSQRLPPFNDVLTAKEVVLRKCGQTEPLAFKLCYPSKILKNCQKIGEGVFGEVFLYRNQDGNGTTVIKIIPIEGELIVNGEKQKKYEDILSEILIAIELSNLRINQTNQTSCFNELKQVKCVKGQYPNRLLELWDLYDETRGSDNDSPDMFNENQLYIVLEQSNGGQDLESFIFNNSVQSYSVFQQIALSLAIAEQQLKFEHRDLHWGNVLVTQVDKDKDILFRFNGKAIRIPSCGVQASIIDFTLSRIEFEGVVIFNDLKDDEEQFSADGDYQFEVYRLMQKHNGNNWEPFKPYTNILWLHYILDKMIAAVRYKNIKSKTHNLHLNKIRTLKNEILAFRSVSSFIAETFL